jgi:hypothetical protein
VRGGGTDHNWELLIDLAHNIEEGACVILTADGGGSAHLVKVRALALASATRSSGTTSANCHPAIGERRKRNAARNPLPFGKVALSVGRLARFESLSDLETIEENGGTSTSLQSLLLLRRDSTAEYPSLVLIDSIECGAFHSKTEFH